jgi:hypothetical protein
MKLRLSILLLAAAALAAASASGQTIKSLGFNTTNGQIVYSGTNALTFTNALQFSTNARAATRTNLGGTTLGNSVFTATNIGTAQIAIFGTNVTINNSAGVEGISLSDGQTKLLSAISFPFLGGAAAAATTRTNLGLGAGDNVTFSNITANGIITAKNSTASPATNSAIASGIQWTNLGGSGMAAIYGSYPGVPQIALSVGTTNALSDVATFRSTGMTVSSNAVVGGTLAVSNTATFATNVSIAGSLTVGSFTTTTPSTWALDATQTAAATNGRLTLPSNANVIRLTNNNAISSVTNGVLGAFYYLVNQATNAVTISNVGGITIDGAQNLTLSPNESATLVATGPTNVSVANRGDLTDVALGGTANTAPSQTASSGSSLMTRDLGDVRYGGPFYYAIAKTDTSVTNSTNTVSAASVTLPTGWYHFEVFWRSVFSAGGSIRQRFWNKSGTTSFGTVVHYQHQNISNTISYSGITRGSGFETNQGVFNLYGFVNITSEAELVIEFSQNTASTNTATIYGGAGMIFRKVE